VSKLVTKIYRESFSLSEDSVVKLESPFDYLNANDFPNDTFVNRLFSDEFPWIREQIIPSAQSILITGPRGSGKTMILRSMRLRARMAPRHQNEQSDQIRTRVLSDPFIGFFISARLEIGNQAPLTKLPHWMMAEELVLYYRRCTRSTRSRDLTVFRRPFGVRSEGNDCILAVAILLISTYSLELQQLIRFCQGLRRRRAHKRSSSAR
jgi:hypothetical protein